MVRKIITLNSIQKYGRKYTKSDKTLLNQCYVTTWQIITTLSVQMRDYPVNYDSVYACILASSNVDKITYQTHAKKRNKFFRASDFCNEGFAWPIILIRQATHVLEKR